MFNVTTILIKKQASFCLISYSSVLLKKAVDLWWVTVSCVWFYALPWDKIAIKTNLKHLWSWISWVTTKTLFCSNLFQPVVKHALSNNVHISIGPRGQMDKTPMYFKQSASSNVELNKYLPKKLRIHVVSAVPVLCITCDGNRISVQIYFAFTKTLVSKSHPENKQL